MQELADMLAPRSPPCARLRTRLWVQRGQLVASLGALCHRAADDAERYMEVRLMRFELEGLAAEIAAQRPPEDIANLRHPSRICRR